MIWGSPPGDMPLGSRRRNPPIASSTVTTSVPPSELASLVGDPRQPDGAEGVLGRQDVIEALLTPRWRSRPRASTGGSSSRGRYGDAVLDRYIYLEVSHKRRPRLGAHRHTDAIRKGPDREESRARVTRPALRPGRRWRGRDGVLHANRSPHTGDVTGGPRGARPRRQGTPSGRLRRRPRRRRRPGAAPLLRLLRRRRGSQAPYWLPRSCGVTPEAEVSGVARDGSVTPAKPVLHIPGLFADGRGGAMTWMDDSLGGKREQLLSDRPDDRWEVTVTAAGSTRSPTKEGVSGEDVTARCKDKAATSW
jgi:hypothetical protein